MNQTEEEDLLYEKRQIKRPLRFESNTSDEDLDNFPRPPKIEANILNFTVSNIKNEIPCISTGNWVGDICTTSLNQPGEKFIPFTFAFNIVILIKCKL
ncbi:hypothetical protein QE152_g10611 [Popillia japonica]|uniref:Uncharacterized protein n=1 Tax=Popillia japonica TaxID=7064 RepID=A0AAW1LUS4_POPJA